jgi:rhodanese-related sulfurtransferase
MACGARAEVIDIDNAALARLAASGIPLIDVRTASEWEQTGIVPGSHLLTFFDERGKSDPAAWLQKAKAIAGPGDPLIVICRSGNRTRDVSRVL